MQRAPARGRGQAGGKGPLRKPANNLQSARWAVAFRSSSLRLDRSEPSACTKEAAPYDARHRCASISSAAGGCGARGAGADSEAPRRGRCRGALIFSTDGRDGAPGGLGVRPEHRRSPKNTHRDAAFRVSKKWLSHHAETSLCRRCAARSATVVSGSGSRMEVMASITLRLHLRPQSLKQLITLPE